METKNWNIRRSFKGQSYCKW